MRKRAEVLDFTLDRITLSPDERNQALPVAFVGKDEIVVLALCEFRFPPLLKRLRDLFGPETYLYAPPSFRFDGTSNPKVTRSIISQFDPYLWATMFHDLAYATELFDVNGEKDYGQREADYWYRELLLHWGLRAWKSEIRYRAVRAFGHIKHPHDIFSVAQERAKHRYKGNPWGVPVGKHIKDSIILRKLEDQISEVRRG